MNEAFSNFTGDDLKEVVLKWRQWQKKVHEMTKNVDRASTQGYVSCIGNFVHYNLRSNAKKLLTIEIHRSNLEDICASLKSLSILF